MKAQYTNYTPIPAQVPRQLAIEILQSHGEIITLNPLVLEHHPIKAPRDCPNDEYYSTWYEITERIQFVPGFKRMGSSKITFRGCFHDMPWGVQTHMYIPMGVDLRNKWQIRGSQPGEPPEVRELGSGAPTSGLYLREEVEIKCNALAVSFVKKETKAASLVMVERMLKKAELLDAGVLHAMFEDGKLKTYNPHDRSRVLPTTPQPASPGSPGRWGPNSVSAPSPDNRTSSYSAYHQLRNGEAPNQHGQIPGPDGQGLAVEMPGDYLYPAQQTDQNRVYSDRYSQASGSDASSENRYSQWSYMTSSDRNSNLGTPRPSSHTTSPMPDMKHFSAELPGSGHKDFEVNKSPYTEQQQQQQQQQHQQQQHQQPPPPPPKQPLEYPPYNPQDYAQFGKPRYA